MSDSSWEARPGQTLDSHLRGVATLAAEYGKSFGAERWAYLAGLWHDLGKYQIQFQRRLAGDPRRVEHSGVGAVWAMHQLGKTEGLPVAFAIAGHHSGLANLKSTQDSEGSTLIERTARNEKLLPLLSEQLSPYAMPDSFQDSLSEHCESITEVEAWTRMLFSALVDADYLDTESFLDPNRAKLRGRAVEISHLVDTLERKFAQFGCGEIQTETNRLRAQVAEDCLKAAQMEPGFFSLTAPTGSGKTLAGMRFALQHCQRFQLRRVIVVLPYTSIIEQNAAVYRDLFGADAVVEHHSNLDPEKEQQRFEGSEDATASHQMACENWDAPIVVTTSVQFFESLFSNRTSRCRKLHRIAQSVVILDEIQAIPPAFLEPIVEMLTFLKRRCGVSIVLSTATPPALQRSKAVPRGLVGVREIVQDREGLAKQLKRVTFDFSRCEQTMEWAELADEIAPLSQALAIVHLRKDAHTLAQQLRARGITALHHLSALMCSRHRGNVLGRVRDALNRGEPCVLVATQLIEAGVDVDFPVVYRALAGMDSMVQAAGRCNREGRRGNGEVRIFKAPSLPPKGILRRGLQESESMLRSAPQLDPLSPKTSEDYFCGLYFKSDLDSKGIRISREGLNFAATAKNFRLIEDGCTEDLLVPYEGLDGILRRFRFGERNREVYRELQPYAVRVYPNALEALRRAGAIEEFEDGPKVLTDPFRHLYDAEFGLMIPEEILPSAESLVI